MTHSEYDVILILKIPLLWILQENEVLASKNI